MGVRPAAPPRRVRGRRSPARRPRSTAARGGAGCGRGGEGTTRRPKLPFSGCSEVRTPRLKKKTQNTKPKPKTPTRGRIGCVPQPGAAEKKALVSSYLPAELQVTPPASAGAYQGCLSKPGCLQMRRDFSADEGLCACSVRGKAPS